MKRFFLPFLALLSSLVFAPSVFAQAASTNDTVVANCGTPYNTPVVGQSYPGTQNTSLQKCVVSSGGGGGGAITAASGSYSAGALSAGAIVDLGTGASPGANTTNGILKTINTTLGTPFQAGGALAANQSVNVSQLNGAAPSLTNPIWIANAEAADTTGTFTNGTQTTSVTNSAADGYAAGLLSINGTYATASGVFEASDDSGTTWYAIICARSDGTASETGYTSLTNVSRQWSCPVGGNDSLRIRSTAVATGTVNARVGVSAPPPSSNTVAGTVTAVQPTGTNLHVVTDTTSTTAVTQATASNLNAAVVGIGAAGTPSGGVVSVQGVAGGTAVPVSGSLSLTGATSNAGSAVATSSTNVPTVSYNYAFNGTTWDQLQDDGSKNLKVTAINGGTFAVQCSACIGTTGGTVGLVAGSAIVGKFGIDQTTGGTTNGVSVAQVGSTTVATGNGVTGTGAQRVTIASDNTAFSVNAQPAPVTTGGLSKCFLIAANSSNSTNCKASAGQVYHISVFNNSASVAYLHMINSSSAPTCTSATTVDQVMVPASGGVEKEITNGDAYATGISFCFSGGIAANDNTSVAASTYSITIYYK